MWYHILQVLVRRWEEALSVINILNEVSQRKADLGIMKDLQSSPFFDIFWFVSSKISQMSSKYRLPLFLRHLVYSMILLQELLV